MVNALLSWIWLVPALLGMVVVHELGHLWMARMMGVPVLSFGFGFGPAIFRHRWKGILYRLNVLPFGGYVEMERFGPGGIAQLSHGRQAAILLAGVFLNVVTGAALVILVSAAPLRVESGELVVLEVVPATPAERAGMRSGDSLLTIEGEAVRSVRALRGRNQRARGPLEYVVARYGERETLWITPVSGRVGIVVEIVDPSTEWHWNEPLDALRDGIVRTWGMVAIPLTAIARGGDMPGGEQLEVAGPVRLAEVTAAAVEGGGVVTALLIAGGLSMHLGILQLVPIPGLDGGQLLFLAIARVRGRPVAWHVQQAAGMFGLAILIGLMTIVLVMDILRVGGH